MARGLQAADQGGLTVLAPPVTGVSVPFTAAPISIATTDTTTFDLQGSIRTALFVPQEFVLERVAFTSRVAAVAGLTVRLAWSSKADYNAGTAATNQTPVAADTAIGAVASYVFGLGGAGDDAEFNAAGKLPIPANSVLTVQVRSDGTGEVDFMNVNMFGFYTKPIAPATLT